MITSYPVIRLFQISTSAPQLRVRMKQRVSMVKMDLRVTASLAILVPYVKSVSPGFCLWISDI